MKNKLFVIATLLLLTGPMAAFASPIAHFELSCVGCDAGGDWTANWYTPFDATAAQGFNEDAPGLFFHIELPEYENTFFFAHSESYPGGYNFYNPLTGDYAAMNGGATIFSGPTSAPVWLIGEYKHVVNYFEEGREGGIAYLSITEVPEPGVLVLLGAGLVGMGFARRKKA